MSSKNFSAMFGKGTSVRIIGVSDRFASQVGHSLPAENTWAPSGSAYVGPKLRQVHEAGIQSALDSSRYLLFEIKTPKPLDVGLIGFVPGMARLSAERVPALGWTNPTVRTIREAGVFHRVPIIPHPKFTLGIATGPWRELARIPIGRLVDGKRIGTTVGVLEVTGPPKKVKLRIDTLRLVQLAIKPRLDQPPQDLRIRLHPVHKVEWMYQVGPGKVSLKQQRLANVKSIVIEGRPYRWFEFRGIAMKPDKRTLSR